MCGSGCTYYIVIIVIWQALRDLHLASLNEFVKFFFVHDIQNYARYAPVYLSEMFELQTNDPATCDFFVTVNVSVNKTKIPFSVIGADHALEQENRGMKVLGELKGSETINQHTINISILLQR